MGRLKDLELENVELRKKIEFLESWLNGDAKPAVTATKDPELKKKLKQMREELAVARAAMKVQEDEVKDLRQKNEGLLQSLDKVKRERDDCIELNKKLTETAETAQRDLEFLQRRTVSGPRRWHYTNEADPTKALPKKAQRVLVCCINPHKIVAQVALNERSINAEFLILDAMFYPDKKKECFVGVPGGYYVAAWQPIVDPNWDRVSDIGIGVTEMLVNDKKYVDMTILEACKSSPEEGALKRYTLNKARAVFEKRTFRPATTGTVLTRNLLFNGTRIK